MTPKSKLIIPSAAEMDAVLGGGGGGGYRDLMKFKGHFKFELFDKDGLLKDVREQDNLITNAGFQLIADSIGNPSPPAVISHIGVGTGTTAAAATQTALVTQVVRVAGTYSYASNVITFTASFAAGTGTGALTEAGIFNAASAGTMLNRVVFSVINKGASDTMTVTFTLTLS